MVQFEQQAGIYAIGHQPLDLSRIRSLLEHSYSVELSENAVEKISNCRNYLDQKLKTTDRAFYGINTGFGFLQHVKIDRQQIEQLQYNLLRSHACGTGDEVPRPIVGLMLLLKAHSLAQGHSGVQLATVQRLLDLYNFGYYPQVFTQGSLGASGDLAPLSHLSLPLIGEGRVSDPAGRCIPADQLSDLLDLDPIALRAKEGLALINGTQFMSAYGAYCLVRAAQLLALADWIAALSCDAFDCSPEPFHPAIHQIRPHPGQQRVAAVLWDLLRQSPLSQRSKSQVQDPYSFRCIPQVHGASRDVFEHCREVVIREINSVTDNPSIFPEQDLIISGGNFHGQTLALSLDALGNAMAELASISERRTFQLISGQRGLPAFLVQDPGLQSGLMIPQYTAASIVSQNKQLCSPASVDSIVSSNGQEDHVSMGANAATKCLRIIENVERVLAIELLTAGQAMAFRRPGRTAPVLEKLLQDFREEVPFIAEDRILSEDIERSRQFITALKLSEYGNHPVDHPA
ncbi:histidine ammonia-lyase [Flavilitoribacter nigricans]|uniref:Histidine ammonia-lyase n=1 Tax=Flavilitoribacter nigricans (strain ATCC 23147 / DSM 23189 / NBRC 102662 / NCIMB 1420 / SS-2) TaxID=1122177 RepID=A0A2D0NCT7_FLAN2|nr:histidine ammonia-lyase [Flavilitoribacter nigricans]PHN06190.1 histidine ammonia-lyase [Flavilitoribacter nigricans DSM 23189 = NBRC 102662]